MPPEGRTRPRTATAILVLLIGLCLLSAGLGGEPREVALWMGGTLLFWTSLLPRLPALKGGEVWVASHGLAAAAFWGALCATTSSWPVVGNSGEQTHAIRNTLALAIFSAAAALAVGWGIDRAARRHPSLTRRALAGTLALSVVLAAIVIPLARGDAPSPSQRLGSLPVVVSVPSDAASIDAPISLGRYGNGTLVTLIDERTRAGYAALTPEERDDDHVRALFPSREAGLHICHSLVGETRALEVRAFQMPNGPLVYVFSPEHALDPDDVDFLSACAFDGVRGFKWRIDVRNLPHPMRASRSLVPIALAALVVAGVQLLLGLVALLRHVRLRRASEGTSDGEGHVELANGTVVALVAPAGPVLVSLHSDARATYRSSAGPTATLVAAESRAQAEARMDLSTCIALAAAVGTTAAAVLPFAALLAQRLVAPF